MLGSMKIVSFVPTRDPKNARSFYEDVLGLRFLSDDQFALEFDANGIVVRVTNVSSVPGFAPAPFTILGWEVPDIKDVVRGLRGRGVQFERFHGMTQDELDIWTSPGGARVAWLRDPDGNVLSVTQR
jgi:catechol 2,3-dioxygenase-like lactoylglutathione lyase family enzyme